MFTSYFGERYLSAQKRREAPRAQKFWSVSNKGDQPEIAIYDEIGFWGTTAAEFRDELNAIKSDRITLRLNSPGGDVFDGLAIFNILKAHPAAIDVVVDGIAASAASFIAMAGDTIKMSRHSMMMIHEAWGFAMGPAADMRKAADMLERLTGEIASIYTERSGVAKDVWLGRMSEETWFNDQEAVDAGLADEVIAAAAAPKNVFDLSMFRHTPLALDHEPESDTHEQSNQPARPDWQQEALLRVGAAQMEVA